MKHKYHDEIVAWASGKPIQFGFIFDDHQNWINFKMDDKSPNFDDPIKKWRIKPISKIIKYRLALMRDVYTGDYVHTGDYIRIYQSFARKPHDL